MAGENITTAGDASARQFTCPVCSGQIRIHAVGQSLSAACVHCSSIVDVSSAELKILQKFKANTKKIDPDIKLGAVGTLLGTKWRCIGLVLQTDATECWYWLEHLLFNPNKGFVWLVENQGHWTVFKKTKYKPKTYGDGVSLYNKNYKLFTADESRVVQALGEFYWRIKVGEKTGIKDYINPPEMLSMAKSDSDVVWSVGEYVTRDQVEEAFNLKNVLPLPRGVAPHQPSPHNSYLGRLFKKAGILLATLTVLQIAFACSTKNKLVHSQSFRVGDLKPGQEHIVSDKFRIDGRSSNLKIHASAAVENNWVHLGMTLINDDTDKAINFDQEVSYYHGYDSDGAWSEGSSKQAKTLSAIPGGNYILTVDPMNLDKINPPEVNVFIYRDVFFMGNYWLGLIYILILPAFVLYRSHRFEVSRWEDSDYSPYGQEE